MSEDMILHDAERVCRQLSLEALRHATVLVTGASGLIGSHFLATLCAAARGGLPLRVFAQVMSAPPPHVCELVGNGGFTICRADLSDPDAGARLPEADVIIHSCGSAQPSLFMSRPVATLQINTTTTAALLRRLRPSGRFLFVSSSEVYSGRDRGLLSERDIGTTAPDHPRASYIEGKRVGEALCHAYRAQGVHAVAARVCNAYGPGTRKHDGRAINSFVEQALVKRRIELRDTGAAVRTLIYVSDAVELMWRAVLFGKETIYNVGGDEPVTIAGLARMIADITGSELVIPAALEGVPGAPADVRLDMSRAATELAWTSSTTLAQGLRATIDWQRQLYYPVPSRTAQPPTRRALSAN